MFGWLKRRLRKNQPDGSEAGDTTMIWGVQQGPVFAHDIPDCGFPDDSVMMLLKISIGEEVTDAEFWFDNMDDAYVIVSHFNKSIEPIPLNNRG